MKTDELIERLADDLPRAIAAPKVDGAKLSLLALLMVASTLCLSVMMFGLRPHGPANGMLGLAIWSMVAVLGLAPLLRVRSPEASPRRVALMPVAGLAALLLVLALWAQNDGKALVRVDHVLHCLQTIGLLSLAPFVGISMLMRKAAPSSPATAGALAGLMAGAVGALAYSVSCPITDPLASLSAHALTVLVITLAGAVVGRRLYAW